MATKRSGSYDTIGGVGGVFDPKAAGYTDPLLVLATDGVGTKLKLAIEANTHNTIGIDLVAMCVNDLVVQGAEPLAFLDYFATSKLNNDIASELISGIATGCKIAGCALIGGETAEMPGLYKNKDYDLAGFALGAVERSDLLPNESNLPKSGDVIIGLMSSGPHANGFSLINKIIEYTETQLDEPAPFNNTKSLLSVLLEPTRIYAQSCLKVISNKKIKAIAHITGGGLIENIPRVLPKSCGAHIEGRNWKAQPVFKWLKQSGSISNEEMTKTFNCGIGMIVVVDKINAATILKDFINSGETAIEIGEVTSSLKQKVLVNNLDEALGMT